MNSSALVLPKHVKFRDEFYSRYEDQTDEYGFDAETIAQWQPFFQFLYEGYFQVRTIGTENIPDNGRAVLIGNHSGVLPMDAFMTYMALLLHHNAPRRIRYLTHESLLSNNLVQKLLRGFGSVPATYETAKKLLEDEELVFFYPEGTRGTGKPFSMRYRLHDFDPGFAKAAIETGSPIIPITTIGGDEIYPLLGNLKCVARLMGLPYWPLTLTHPWFPFVVSCIPMPVKFLIKIGKPIYLDYPPGKATDKKLRLQIARNLQYDIQRDLNSLLKERKSPFAGW